MLKISNLKSFAQQCVNEIAILQDYHVVASDDELSGRIRDMVHPDDTCSLVLVIPNHDGLLSDEDNRRFRNNLIFMVIKKTDSKAGIAHRESMFEITQEVVLDLVKKVVALHHNDGLDCMFRDIDLNTIQVDPIQDYYQTNGYSLGFTTITKF